MQQQFDTSSDPVEEPEEIIFEESNNMLAERHKRFILYFLVIILITISAYLIFNYFFFRNIPFYFIAHIIGICLFFISWAVIWFLIEPWLLVHIYLKAARAVSKRENPLYAPIRVDISPPDPNFSTSNDILELLQLLDKNVLILGSPGAGKTIALRTYQQRLLAHRQLRHKDRPIPVFISLKDFNAFLKSPDGMITPLNSQSSADGETVNIAFPRLLRNYLYSSKGPENIRSLNVYLPELLQSGRVLLLCDGLNEVDSDYREELCEELSVLMVHNRVIMTCRELDYYSPVFETMVSEQSIQTATIRHLERDQQDTFIQQYFKKEYELQPDEAWQRASEEVLHIIDTKKLRSECGNPFILWLLTRTLRSIGATKEINTRGQLFREAISLLIDNEIQGQLFTKDDLLLYLGEIACTIRRMKARNGLLLSDLPYKDDDANYYPKAAAALKRCTDSPLVDIKTIDPPSRPEPTDFPDEIRIEMLKFAVQKNLISISHSEHILSFSHELIAEYFVAEYFHRICQSTYERDNKITLPYGKELISTEGDWNEPMRIWAGLLDNATFLNSMFLAELLGKMGIDCQFDEDKDRMYNALTLGMLCLGVHWTPSSILQQEPPSSLCDLLRICISDEEKRAHLRAIFERCAQEGGDAVYRPLLKVLAFKGADKLLLLLPKVPISNLLFEYLSIIDGGAYEKETRSLTVILGTMGSIAVERAVELSKPSAMKSIRMRRAGIGILGYTRDANVVAPLLRCLDEEQEITDEAVKALQRLGPEIASGPLRQEFIFAASLKANKRNIEILKVLKTFLQSDEMELNPYIDCIKDLLQVLSSLDPYIQREAKNLLICEARTYRRYAQQVKEELILALPGSAIEEVLTTVGSEATNNLLTHLRSADATDMMRVSIVKILGNVQNHSALDELLNRVGAASPQLRSAVARALCQFPIDLVIPKLIVKVLHSSKDEAAAACDALELFGRGGVELISRHLFDQAIPGRVALLVQILQRLGDERAIPHLINLMSELMERLHTQLSSLQAFEALAVDVVKALSSFKNVHIVEALLNILNTWPFDTYKKVYTQASLGLSSQGERALPTLLSALNIEKEIVSTCGVWQAIVMMEPFPEVQLLNALSDSSDAQVRYIKNIFVERGKKEAPFLVQHLCHTNMRIRDSIHQILERLDGETIVEPLLEVLSDDVCRSTVIQHLRRYPDIAIPRLVELLSDVQLGKTTVQVLIEFDILVTERLHSLVRAFDKPNSSAAQRAEQVIVELTKLHKELLYSIVKLFHTITSDEYAYEAIVRILSTSLAYGSMSILLNELASENPRMKQGVIDTLVLLGRENEIYSEDIIHELIAALSMTEKRSQAEEALVRIGKKAVSHVGSLAISTDPVVRHSIHAILSKMGPLAFDILFSHLSSHDSEHRSAAEHIIANMEAKDIKDPLLQLLSNQNVQRVEQGLVLLLGRVRVDLRASSEKQKMVTVLLEHIQTHKSDHTTVLILNFLLLLPERRQLLETFNQVLSKYLQTQQWFMPLFLLMNMEDNEAKTTLLRLLQEGTTVSLEKEFVGILGMLEPNELVTKYATSIGAFAQAAGMPLRDNQIFQIERSHRAIGSLLVSDYWNTQKLRELQSKEPVESIRHELYTILLGESYVPNIRSLRDKNKEKEALLKQAKDTIDQLENKNKELTRQKEGANELIGRLSREKTDLGREKKEALDENTNLSNRIVGLSRDIERLSRENESLRHRSIPPYRPRF